MNLNQYKVNIHEKENSSNETFLFHLTKKMEGNYSSKKNEKELK